MPFHTEAIPGLIFSLLYTINFSILVYGYTTRRIAFKSVYTLLLVHVLFRLAAQGVGLSIGVNDELNIGLLIAYFVLGAEGYFSLVLCAYRFVVHHHEVLYPTSGSWLEPRDQHGTVWRRFVRSMTARGPDGKRAPWVMTWVHWVLIVANTLIVVSGTQANGTDTSDPSYASDLHLSQILRAVGQALFLLINLFLLLFLFLSVKQDRNPEGTLPARWTRILGVAAEHGKVDAQVRGPARRLHPTLKLLFAAWPFLVVRGVFGILQAEIDVFNYSTDKAYTDEGFTNTFVIAETLMGVLPEWTACCLLCATLFTRERAGEGGRGKGAREGEAEEGGADNGPQEVEEDEGRGSVSLERTESGIPLTVVDRRQEPAT